MLTSSVELASDSCRADKSSSFRTIFVALTRINNTLFKGPISDPSRRRAEGNLTAWPRGTTRAVGVDEIYKKYGLVSEENVLGPCLILANIHWQIGELVRSHWQIKSISAGSESAFRSFRSGTWTYI